MGDYFRTSEGLLRYILYMRVQVISLCVIVVGLLISFGLAKNLYTAYQNSKILSDAQVKLTELRGENSRLKSEVSEASNPSYVDNEARKKLGLVRPGEVEVIILQQSQVATASSEPSNAGPSPVQEVKAVSSSNKGLVVWKEWWSFIFR